MIYRLLVILVLCVTTSVAFGKKRKARQSKPSPPYKWYYLVPVDATADWTYEVPECEEVSKEDYKILAKPENCKDLPEKKAEACLSRADRELRNAKTNEKKAFALNYILFESMKACEEDRAKIVPAVAAAPVTTTSTTTTIPASTSTTTPAQPPAAPGAPAQAPASPGIAPAVDQGTSSN